MTALVDTGLSPKVENTAGSREQENHGALAPRFLPAALKQLFSDVKKVLTARDESAPEVKRKRREETGRAFRMTARKLVCRVVRLPAEAYARATTYLSDTLDWLNQWHYQDDVPEDVQPAPQEQLYPHL
jgi:hypothetical protein